MKARINALVSDLKASRDLLRGKRLHAAAVQSGDISNVYVTNTLVSMYARCGSLKEAHRLFDEMEHPTVVSWTALISGYADSGKGELALELFSSMQREGCLPNPLTFVVTLKACTVLAAKEAATQLHGKLVKPGSLDKGMAIHSKCVASRCSSDLRVANTLVDMYAKCGSMENACKTFAEMPHHTVVSWNALLFGYAENGEWENTLDLFASMEHDGCAPNDRTFVAVLKACSGLAGTEEAELLGEKLVKSCSLERGRTIHFLASRNGCESSIFLESTLVDMYAKCGSIGEAYKVFESMKRHDVVSWTALILGHADNGEGEQALELFSRMGAEGCTPNALTFAAALKACGMVGALETGKALHLGRSVQNDAVLLTCLVDFYGKCGSMSHAQQVFDSHPTRDVMTWNALMAGYSRLGDASSVLEIYRRMLEAELQPDRISFCCLLTACSHSGLVEKGVEYFEKMVPGFGVHPDVDHYHTVIDMLGRANRLEDAVALVRSMRLTPNVVTWMTVLGVCRKWKNAEVAELAFHCLLRLDDRNAGAFVLMADIYASRGMWLEQSSVEAMRKKLGACKKRGQSWWIDQAASVHKFVDQEQVDSDS